MYVRGKSNLIDRASCGFQEVMRVIDFVVDKVVEKLIENEKILLVERRCFNVDIVTLNTFKLFNNISDVIYMYIFFFQDTHVI